MTQSYRILLRKDEIYFDENSLVAWYFELSEAELVRVLKEYQLVDTFSPMTNNQAMQEVYIALF